MAHEGRFGASEVAKAMSYLAKRADEAEAENKELRAEMERLRAAAGGEQGGEGLRTALEEIHRRTGLLLHQNTGRWDASLEHDRRTIGVLQVNQEIAFDALAGGVAGGEQASPSTESANTSNT